jgi:hypothetical protein
MRWYKLQNLTIAMYKILRICLHYKNKTFRRAFNNNSSQSWAIFMLLQAMNLSGLTNTHPFSLTFLSLYQWLYTASYSCIGPTQTVAMSIPIVLQTDFAASIHARPPIPVKSVNFPLPTRSIVETCFPRNDVFNYA